jgi:hypothetical protein
VLAWERGELFPTKQYVDRMESLRARGPGSIPRKATRGAKTLAPPMKVLAEPAFWALVRKLAAHGALRDEVARLAAGYSDPAAD